MGQGNDGFNTSVLALMCLAMEDGFETCLFELARFHDNQAGPWLDQIETDIMSGVKGSLVEGVDMKIEAAAMEAAVAELEEFLKNFRDDLEKE